MTNSVMLRQKIEASGYKLAFIAMKCSLTYSGLLKKLNNESEFKASEIITLTNLLGLSDEERDMIFFYDCGR